MVCIKVSREELRKISCGKEGKIKVKTVPGEAKDGKELMNIFDNIIKGRYLGRRRNT